MNAAIRKAAVLGAGTMGARIAAHLANAGVPCFLLDIRPGEPTAEEAARKLTADSPEVRNRIVRASFEAAKKARPAAFFTPDTARLVTIGNFDDNIAWCAEADWIIEVVAENLDIKRKLLERVEQHRRPGTLVTTNTSGLPVRLIAEGRSEDFRRYFAGTHFFNPPRYMKLVELIPGPDTRPQALAALDEFCDRALGKGVVIAKDTPNFIANRIGTFSMLNVLALMQELDMTIEEVDACTGPAVGWPKSATFRTADIVGLDVLVHVVRNIYDNATADEMRERYRVPALVEDMMKRGWLGDKTGGGFYKRVKGGEGKEILSLDWKMMDYRPRAKARLGSIEAGKSIEDTRERLRELLGPALAGRDGDKGARFLWRSVSEMCLYAARRVPEIADHVVDVDRAMRWGFAWEMGPFEIWDAAGVEAMAKRIETEGRPLPPLVTALLSSGRKSFYRSEDGRRFYFDLASKAEREETVPAGVIILDRLRAAGREIEKNAGASLLDLGDGVVCCEFHSKMNSIGADTVQMLHAGLRRLKSDFDAMVIANQAPNFCVGANLMMVLMLSQEQEWDEVDLAVRQFQNVNLALKHAPKPVVAAPFGLSLGGGCEIPLHAARIQAAAETYIGLVEVGVGLIPGGGGTKEMVIRANEHARSVNPSGGEGSDLDLFHALKPVFEQIAMAKVATSAEEARAFGYLRPSDALSMNKDRQVADAKALALELVREGYRPGHPPPAEPSIRVLGEQFLAGAKLAIHMMLRGQFISEYDALVGRKLANILAGGPLSASQLVSEQYLLDLEREAFVSLCSEKKTQERMAHTLKTGKPLRN
ncbi:MAG TPA: 3-hydroxyacyl-CoA dehydrogenase NAD-binding domain-containing protein [Patescibacteria group bacterium]|nr:3-hydroxyacyl-CoA dehydrogenase NAD-binding domain-containing protein [Patescibacteria group bacterium]